MALWSDMHNFSSLFRALIWWCITTSKLAFLKKRRQQDIHLDWQDSGLSSLVNIFLRKTVTILLVNTHIHTNTHTRMHAHAPEWTKCSEQLKNGLGIYWRTSFRLVILSSTFGYKIHLIVCHKSVFWHKLHTVVLSVFHEHAYHYCNQEPTCYHFHLYFHTLLWLIWWLVFVN